MSQVIRFREEFIYFFRVEMGNLVGDPDNGNRPKMNAITGRAFVSRVCLGYHINHYLGKLLEGVTGQENFFRPKICLEEEQKALYNGLKLDPKGDKATNIRLASAEVNRRFGDLRRGGHLLCSGNTSCGGDSAPIILVDAQAVNAPTWLHEDTNAMDHVMLEADKERHMKKYGAVQGNFSRRALISDELFVTYGFISPHKAAKTGCTEEDRDYVYTALANMWDDAHSAVKGRVIPVKLVAFRHDNAMGRYNSHKLFERVKTVPKVQKPVMGSDWSIEVDKTNMPQGVELLELIE